MPDLQGFQMYKFETVSFSALRKHGHVLASYHEDGEYLNLKRKRLVESNLKFQTLDQQISIKKGDWTYYKEALTT